MAGATTTGIVQDYYWTTLQDPNNHYPDINATVARVLGGVLIICMVVGIPSNLLSLIFFLKKSNKTIHDILYTIASITDTCTLILAFAPISVLISDTGRSEIVFETPGICKSWNIAFYFTTRFSLFVVMMLSINRTISMKAPFYIVNGRAVVVVCIVYAVCLLLKDGLFIGMGVVHLNYDWALCIYEVYKTSEPLVVAFVASVAVEVVLVILIIFVNFIICLIFLTKKSAMNTGDAAKFRSGSITITIFTAICLTCTLPAIIVLTLKLIGILDRLGDNILPYVQFVPYVFLIAVNAAINPCVYITRMSAYRKWVVDLFKKEIAKPEKTTSSHNYKPLLQSPQTCEL